MKKILPLRIECYSHGVYRRTESVTETISDEEINSATLYFKNHSPLDLIENEPQYFSMGAIDPEDVQKIEINGDVYMLNQVE